MCALTLACVVSAVRFRALQLAKERGWLQFASLEFDYEHETGGEGRTYTITATGGLNNDPTYNAEYVDVEYDGVQRTTGASMDLGSISFGGSMRGGSLNGSLGRSPRSPLLPRSPLGGAGGTRGVSGDDVPELAPKVGSAPAASSGMAAAAAAGQGSNGCSRLRPGGVVAGGSRFQAGEGQPAVAADAVPGRGGEPSRVLAGQQLHSFSVRVSNETSFSDSGDAPPSPGAVTEPVAGTAVQQVDSGSGSGAGSSNQGAGSSDMIHFE